MKIKGEKTISGPNIKTPEQFIEDLSDGINGVIDKIMEFEDEKMQLEGRLKILLWRSVNI